MSRWDDTLERSDPINVGSAAGCWLYVIGWELHHAGGVNEVLRNLYDLTAQRLHHRPLLLVRSWDQTRPRTATVDGRRTIYASWPEPFGNSRGWRQLLSFIVRLPRALVQLRTLLREERVTTVHVHYPSLDAWIWPLTGLLGGVRPRLILSFHGLDLKAVLQTRGVSRLAWRRLLAAADHIILCSDALRDSLQSQFPHLAGRLRVIENGVDRAALERIAVQPPAHAIPSPFLFSVGTYEWKKGHDVLIQAFAEIAHRFPDLSLVIAGRYEPDEYARLDALRSTLSLADRVRLLIDLPHEETMRLMSRANAFVLASREEPFGIVLLEAGIFQLPVITTTVCGALKHLQTGSELIAVPPEDVHQLAEAITQVLSDGQTSQAMGARLGAAVRTRLDWTRIIESYAGLSARATDQSE